MQSRKLGMGIALVALVAVVGLFLLLRDDDPDTATPPELPEQEAPAGEGEVTPEPAEPPVATITLRDGEPVGGVQRLTFNRGERIVFVVRSDTDEELHLHGYDVVEDVEAGGRARFDVEAELEGVFEVETHRGHATIAEVAVRP